MVAANDCRNAIVLGARSFLDRLPENVVVDAFGGTDQRVASACLNFGDFDSVGLHQGIAGVR